MTISLKQATEILTSGNPMSEEFKEAGDYLAGLSACSRERRHVLEQLSQLGQRLHEIDMELQVILNADLEELVSTSLHCTAAQLEAAAKVNAFVADKVLPRFSRALCELTKFTEQPLDEEADSWKAAREAVLARGEFDSVRAVGDEVKRMQADAAL